MFPGTDFNLPQHLAMAGLQIDPDLKAQPAAHLRYVLTLAGSVGCGGVHLDATAPGLRPRELDRSARRDVAATIRRQGLGLSGVDLLIPPSHFTQVATMSRAMDAAFEAIGLIRELAGLLEGAGRVCSFGLPRDLPSQTLQTLLDQAQREDVQLAIEWSPAMSDAPPEAIASAVASPSYGHMLDLASELLAGRLPHESITKLGLSLACIRVGDADRTGRVPIGTGRLDRDFTIAAIQTCTKLAPSHSDPRTCAVVLDGAGLSVASIRRLEPTVLSK